MTYFLHTVVLLFGLCTVGLSVVLAHKFYHTGVNLGRSLSVMLVGEAFVGLGTCTFALLSFMGYYPSDAEMILLRSGMFTASAVTSIHLFLTVRRVYGTS